MAVKHSTLTGSDLHEPKGISSATSNETYVADGLGSGAWAEPEPKGISAANSGDVYIADGLGSGAWTDPSGSTFGEMAVTNNATTFGVTAASDSTLNTDSDYVKIDTGIWAEGQTQGVTFNANGYLEIVTSGTYEVSFWMSYSVDVINTLTAMKYSTDDTNATLSARKLSRFLAAADDVGAAAASSYVPLSAGDKLSLWMAADNSVNVTAEDAGFTVVLLRAD